MLRVVLVVLVALLFVAVCSAASPGCRGETGQPVDWWVILKAPDLSSSPVVSVRNGLGYLYATQSERLNLTDRTLDVATSGALSTTLNQVYGNSGLNYLMYNDQSPDGISHNSFGHLKGVMGFDSVQGFWLVHSVPRFPLGPASTPTYQGYPAYASVYGQSLLCVTFNISQLDKIAAGLYLDKPFIFDKNVSTSMPNLNKLIGPRSSQPTSNILALKLVSVGGRAYTGFFKTANWDRDLYSELVQPTFLKDMYWETWMNGANTNKMPTFCKPAYPFSSINIREITAAPGVAWRNTQDHSKWGISASSASKRWVCIGDINRQFSQSNRGGGTLCRVDRSLWDDFNDTVSMTDTCP